MVLFFISSDFVGHDTQYIQILSMFDGGLWTWGTQGGSDRSGDDQGPRKSARERRHDEIQEIFYLCLIYAFDIYHVHNRETTMHAEPKLDFCCVLLVPCRYLAMDQISDLDHQKLVNAGLLLQAVSGRT
jgi:hypothetical protein